MGRLFIPQAEAKRRQAILGPMMGLEAALRAEMATVRYALGHDRRTDFDWPPVWRWADHRCAAMPLGSGPKLKG